MSASNNTIKNLDNVNLNKIDEEQWRDAIIWVLSLCLQIYNTDFDKHSKKFYELIIKSIGKLRINDPLKTHLITNLNNFKHLKKVLPEFFYKVDTDKIFDKIGEDNILALNTSLTLLNETILNNITDNLNGNKKYLDTLQQNMLKKFNSTPVTIEINLLYVAFYIIAIRIITKNVSVDDIFKNLVTTPHNPQDIYTNINTYIDDIQNLLLSKNNGNRKCVNDIISLLQKILDDNPSQILENVLIFLTNIKEDISSDKDIDEEKQDALDAIAAKAREDAETQARVNAEAQARVNAEAQARVDAETQQMLTELKTNIENFSVADDNNKKFKDKINEIITSLNNIFLNENTVVDNNYLKNFKDFIDFLINTDFYKKYLDYTNKDLPSRIVSAGDNDPDFLLINNLTKTIKSIIDKTEVIYINLLTDTNIYKIDKSVKFLIEFYKDESSLFGGGSNRKTRRHLRKLARRSRRMKYTTALNRLKF